MARLSPDGVPDASFQVVVPEVHLNLLPTYAIPRPVGLYDDDVIAVGASDGPSAFIDVGVVLARIQGT